MARTRSNTQRARISASAAGASGKAEKPGRRPWRPPKPDRPPLRKPSGWTRGRSGPAGRGRAAPPRQRSGLGRGRAAGRRGRATAAAASPQAQLVANGEAQVAQRACVGVEAQDLGGGRGALKREAGAQRAGAGRVAAQEGVEQERGRRRRRTADRPALPFRSPAPRPGSAPAAERLAFPGFSPGSARLARAVASGAGTPSPGSAAGRRAGRGWRESPGHGEIVGGALSLFCARNPPRLSWRGDVR